MVGFRSLGRVRQGMSGFAALVGAVLGGAVPVGAHTAFGLRPDNSIVRFDTSAPGTALGGAAITGLQPGETALAIDLRRSTGQL